MEQSAINLSNSKELQLKHPADIMSPFQESASFDRASHDSLYEFMDIKRYLTLRVFDTDGLLDIHKTAAHFGACVIYGEPGLVYSDEVSGMNTIELPVVASREQQLFMLGHELGHIVLFDLIPEEAMHDYASLLHTDNKQFQLNEHFCDYFAAKLLDLPEDKRIDFDNFPKRR